MHAELMILLALAVPDPIPEQPTLWELDRFPSAAIADRQECLCVRALWWVDRELETGHVAPGWYARRPALEAWRAELQRRRLLWGLLVIAAHPARGSRAQRESLATMRFWMRPEDWSVGLMPPVLLEGDYPPIPEMPPAE